MSRGAELETWLQRLEQDGKPGQLHIVLAARAMLAAIDSTPDSQYRELAVCKLTDTVIAAAVAARQPETQPCPN